jgi:hypothetical protein
MNDEFLSLDVDGLAGVAPKSILLFERIHYDWLHPRFIEFLQSNYGTKFSILTPKNAVAERRRGQIGESGRILYADDIESGIDARQFTVKEERAIASSNEKYYGVSYLRDLVQQERWLSTYFVGYAQNSYFGQFRPPPMDELIRKINHYFEYAASIFDERGIDCVIGWPSYSLLTAVITHVALKRNVPFTFLIPGRRDFRLMWSDGPYVNPRFMRQVMNSINVKNAGSTPPTRTPPADTLAAIAELPKELRLSTYVQRLMTTTRDYAIWAAQDLLKFKRSKRKPYFEQVHRLFRDWSINNYVSSISTKNLEELTEQPFLFFPLPYEPEYPNTSLAREFNDTLAFAKQTALAAPAGYNLVIKEHVVGVGHRPRSLYEDLLRFPNVRFADNSLKGIDLVQRCAAVVTINGTAGLEAGYFGKKAVLFSPNIEYCGMRHVRVVEKMKDLPTLLREAATPAEGDELQAIIADVHRHYRAIEKLCVDVSKIDVFGGTESALTADEYEKLFRRFLQTYEFLHHEVNCSV